MNVPTLPLGTYRHYKQKDYEVVGVVIHSETREYLVLYKPLYDCPELPDGQLFVRPYDMFTEEVEVDGQMVPRFAYQGD